MKKINLKNISFTLLATFVLVSCDNYLDINESPNGPSGQKLVPEIVMPGAQTTTSATLLTTMNILGNTMVSTWSGNAQQIQTPYSNEFQYLVTPEFYGNIWENLYERTSNFTHIIEFEDEKNYDYHKASSLILRAYYFQYLVDLYGDIPYSEAHGRGNKLFPSYDDAETVYFSLISDINKAILLIDNTNVATVVSMGASDPMLGGDMDMWKKFGNTVKLRLLVRMMDKAQTDSSLDTFITNEIADINTTGMLLTSGENITINPGYSDEANRMNPFAATFGYTPGNFGTTSQQTTSNTATGPTTFLVDFLNGTTTGVIDPRLDELYTLRGSQSVITGNIQGGNDNLPSRLGPGLLNSATQDGYIMTASEALFLQAEANHRGYLTIGNAKSYYDAAVQASFDMLNSGNANNIINSGINLLDWNASTGNEIETIITQKWIALGGTNGIETWIEFNRTGFPSNMPLPVSTSRTQRPYRLLYPSSEYVGNSSNVTPYNQTTQTAFTEKIFWDVN
ncbi:SusD/RagB family nutrient-binding outer membrane lipoprotein [Flavobacterium jejuense]|uniref:SusD/RagB family nutrient-binding outer membrane lipoprotein n=1 Tax=Flavobacterium jejuense TaxID=1544455 RepID=A0ABX0ITB3_9FLAO|nr:SusD/RagB family nutrient-binding outer membrane lipoprotein [Flavobacterium jejuense]NHN26052.1 SusD/RagB family nutrient-binding outer membrane lipoprotein [Flavobacterium jejuense]